MVLSLPETIEDANAFGFSVSNKGKQKGIAWLWRERVHPKKRKVPNPGVIAVPVADLGEKELLLAAHPGWLFTEPHYNGYAVVLVRLAEVNRDELRDLLINAWCCAAPAALVEVYKSTASQKKSIKKRR